MFLYFLLSFICGLTGACIALKYGSSLGLSDVPVERSSHSKITPKGGGLGIVLSFAVLGFYLDLSFLMIFPCVIVSSFSFLGDIRDISPLKRLVLQFVMAIVFLLGIFTDSFSFIHCLIIIFGSVFLTGTANFYNFMDGIDGIAGITGVVSFWLLGWYSFINDFEPDVMIICFAVSFSCLGFLILNFPRAKVFMGDVGSIFLGFLFAGFTLVLSDDILSFISISGFLSLFYFDELLSMFFRLRKGESLLKPHRKHFYQLLVNEAGISHWKVSLSYGLIQLLIGFVIIFFGKYGIFPLFFFYLSVFLIFLGLFVGLRKRTGA